MLADLVALPRKLVLVVMFWVESRVTLSVAANLQHSLSTWRRDLIAKFMQDGPDYRKYWAVRWLCPKEGVPHLLVCLRGGAWGVRSPISGTLLR